MWANKSVTYSSNTSEVKSRQAAAREWVRMWAISSSEVHLNISAGGQQEQESEQELAGQEENKWPSIQKATSGNYLTFAANQTSPESLMERDRTLCMIDAAPFSPSFTIAIFFFFFVLARCQTHREMMREGAGTCWEKWLPSRLSTLTLDLISWSIIRILVFYAGS